MITADIRLPEAAARALAGRRFDAVVDFIAYVPEHIEADLALFAGRMDQYVSSPAPRFTVARRRSTS